ncbi:MULTISPECIES: RNA polymerase sigma factor SigZ [Tenacibaculum]|uniref:RNA polymerase sigma factor SigZ n=1 Tax=Tenacibaculum TaxID=104267 RepID=UPI00089A2147|nr:RNA polymerase sigma factor SigZ [Tenacibaculum sp. MAR_2010_89]SEE59396.1 RNA polymerase, sigma subunit, SigZ [Tenacibaculum sp. MAR_2010_89]
MNTEIIHVWNTMNDRLTNFVNGKVKDTELTKDIVQDVFLKVFTKFETLKNKEKLIAWIYQITRNEIVSHFRKLKYNESSDNIDSEDLHEDTLTSELTSCLSPFINSLPDKYKQAIILADIENIPQKEIAKLLNISYSGTKSRVQRGREMLKSAYEDCCIISTDVYGDVIDYKEKKCKKKCD